MKKIKVFLILAFSVISILCHAHTLSAAPSFGTVMPEGGRFTGGGEASLVFERDVKEYQDAESNKYYYTCSYGFTDWFSIDGKVGLGDVTTKQDFSGSVRYRTNFSGGYGCRARLFGKNETDLRGTLAFEHISTHPNSKQIDGIPYHIIWDNWQVQFLASKSFKNINPYCGIKWSLLYLIRKIDWNRTRRRSRDPIGFIVGTEVKMNKYVYINIEGRFFDETALSTGFTVKY